MINIISNIIPTHPGTLMMAGGGLTFDQLLAQSPPVKFASNPIILHDATYTNISPGSSPFVDPTDSSKLIMFVGEFKGNSSIDARVALYQCASLNPYDTWTRLGTAIVQGVDNTYFDQFGVRFGCHLVVGSNIYYYYVGLSANTGGKATQSVCLGISSDGGRTFVKQGRVLIPDQVNDWNITDPFVFEEGGTLYMYYTAKSNLSTPLPTLGIKLATSTDYLSWSRVGTSITLGDSRAFDGKYIEGCSVIKLGTKYVMFYTTSSNSNIWTIGIASSDSPPTSFTKESVAWFQHSLNSTGDSTSVAVEFIYKVGNKLYLVYQSSDQPQPATIWDIGIAELMVDGFDDFPPGFLAGRGGWTGDAFFDTTGALASSLDRVVRALDNTGFVTVQIDKTIDLTAGAGTSYKNIMRISTGTGGFRAGLYLMEGSNVITGIYFDNGFLKYLRSTGWTNLQAYSASTNYTIEVFLPTNSTVTVTIGGVPIVSNQPVFTNIVTKVDKLRFEKSQASTAVSYFADIQTNNLGAGYNFIDIGQ